jgi:hypothetical protein
MASHTPHGQAAPAENTHNHIRNAKGLFVAALPLIVILGSAATGFARHQLQTRRVAVALPPTGITQAQVGELAQEVCGRITDGPVAVEEPALYQTNSPRRHRIRTEWGVGCRSESATYMLRVNAENGKVYAVNRLDERESGNTDLAAAPMSPQQRRKAEQIACHYLQLLEVTATTPVAMVNNQVAQHAASTTGQWNFTYKRSVPGAGTRLVKVSVSRDGSLRSLLDSARIF